MLLTWMAFRGKFPRAEPLHFLDGDYTGQSLPNLVWRRGGSPETTQDHSAQ